MNYDKDQVVLVDTNVIIEAHATNVWKSIADFFALETVAKCVEETQTGYQNRTPEQQIDQSSLLTSFVTVHDPSEEDRFAVRLEHESLDDLDAGERDLIVHAFGRTDDVWLLASPDKAAMRFISELNLTNKLVSLESMAKRVGAKPRKAFKAQYTEKWHVIERSNLLLSTKN